ncbi:ammonium transporter [Rhodococcus sp. ACPA4]|nr:MULTISPECIES: ammonium transporter [Rhodococcus]NMD61632.1 ammonium transporter [Nocardia globerula]MCE4265573.1 ammonium transporter [Rhodococcus globerulus]MDV6265738.1 ammonium transporter [Rhodococcus globerulus]MDV8067724.1 ammonium transporter [Rhodococcus sp. IEGM 1366]NRI69950.1 ammonium transporter [Rhodococcus sp. MS16]
MLMAASLVLLMTPGVAFFYGGMSRSKSVLNMMMMSFGSMAVIGVIYVLWGWSMSYGTENIGGIFANPFEFFGLKDSITDADGNFIAGAWGYPNVIDIAFQVTFAIITTALISGALAERVKFGTWMLFSGIWVTVVYFPLAHMVWGGGLLSGSEDGIAAKIFGTTDDGDGGLVAAVPPIDFAGGTVVHINAGMAALVLALIVGKRAGFGKTAFRPHNLPLVMLGAALLWFGWFGFNAGSAFAADGFAGLAWVNTTTATAAAILAWLLTERIRDGHATSLGAASGAVAGLVAITPAAGALNPVGSIFLGAIAGILSALAVGLKFRFGFDDSLDVVGVHLVSGLWGTIGIGFFGTSTGLFYGGDYKQLVVQIVIAVVALVFTGVLTAIIGYALKPLGWRISAEDEARGIDETQHAETAYDLA